MNNWYDDKNIIALSYATLLKNEYAKVYEKHKNKCLKIENYLLELVEMERKNILDPDKASECFGKIMGEAITPYEDEYTENLREFGESIGKFIYILDACIDRDLETK